MTDSLKKVFPYLLIAPAVLPLVYVSGLVFPYISVKIFLLWGLGITATALFTYGALSGWPFFYQRLRNKVTWIPLALLAVEYGTSFFGIDFYRSFWGLFERGDGLLTSTTVTLFFYLILVSADRIFLERLVKTIAVVASIVASIAVLQWVTTVLGGKAAFLPPVTGRIGSTLGNAAFLAGYLGMSVFVILLTLRDSVGVWRRLLQASALLSVLAIVLAATRGTMLALLAAGSVGLLFIATKATGEQKRFARYGLVAIAVIVGLFFVFRTQLAQSPFEPVRRVAQISLSDGLKGTVSSRLFVWSHISEEALKRPLLGYGAEHIAQIFDTAYDPSQIVEQWFNRSHNAFLDYFVQYGIFGLALYLALIGVFILYALRLRAREEVSFLNPGLLFSLLILTYVVQNFFVFDTPHSLWLLYALFASLIVLSEETLPATLVQKRIPSFVSVCMGAGILLMIIPSVVFPFYANILLTKGYVLHIVDVERANAYFERGLALGTFADLEYGYQAYDMYTAHQADVLIGKERVRAYEYALSVLSANFKKYSYDARTATYLGHVLDTAPPGVAIDDTFNQQVLSRAITLSPLRAQAWYMLANMSLRKADELPQGDLGQETYFREAIAILEEYAQKEPTLPLPRYTLASIYYKLGDMVAAKKWADTGYSLYVLSDVAVAKPAVKYYLAVGEWKPAVRFLQDLIENNPSDYATLYDLAKVTYLAGDPAAAERIVVQLRATNPDILKTDQNFVAAITAYEQSQK